MNDAEVMKVVTNMIRRQERERKIAWAMTPVLVLCAYLAGRHHPDLPLVIPTAATARGPEKSPVAVESPGPIEPDDLPWSRPGGLPSERPKYLSGAELEQWLKSQREHDEFRALYPGSPPSG